MNPAFNETQNKIIAVLNKKKTKLKVDNYILIETQKVNREIYVKGYPYWLTLDPTNTCNLRCPFCPTGQGRNSRTKAAMSFDDFKNIIDDLGPYLIHIDLCNWGEPLLNKDIFNMVEYAKRFEIDIKIDTNLNNKFSEDEAERLVKSGLDKLIVSIDGASPETYKKYRVGGDFNRVTDNLKLIIKTKRKLKTKNPYVSWQFLVFRHNEHEIQKATRMAKALGVEHIGITKAFIGHKDWIPLNPQYSHYDYEKIEKEQTDYTANFFKLPQGKLCNWPWEAIVINSNGSVSPCCSVEDEKDDFGNIFNTSFKEIWNNEKYMAAREYIKNKTCSFSDNHNTCIGCWHSGMINLDIMSCHSLF